MKIVGAKFAKLLIAIFATIHEQSWSCGLLGNAQVIAALLNRGAKFPTASKIAISALTGVVLRPNWILANDCDEGGSLIGRDQVQKQKPGSPGLYLKV
jgi:hypothetical protein